MLKELILINYCYSNSYIELTLDYPQSVLKY